MSQTEVMWAKIDIGRHSLTQLQSMASLLNVRDFWILNEEDLRRAVQARQKEILKAHGLGVER